MSFCVNIPENKSSLLLFHTETKRDQYNFRQDFLTFALNHKNYGASLCLLAN